MKNILSTVTLSSFALGANLPTIHLPKDGSMIDLATPYFSNTTDGTPAQNFTTKVGLAYDAANNNLIIHADLLNDPYVSQNQYTQDNSAMWNQEVFEMFISAGGAAPTQYMEIEINPLNALFSAYITNEDQQGDKNTLQYFNGREQGITLSTQTMQNAWNATLVLPLALVNNGQPTDTYRINFYRLVSQVAHDPATQWKCTPTTCAYLAWSPTYSGAVPAFHRPLYFGTLMLTD